MVHSVMATEIGFSHTTIRRIWNAFGMQPHRSQTFKLSSDPLFVDKVRDIVGLYLSPPNRALALSVDEKTSYKRLIASSAGAFRSGERILMSARAQRRCSRPSLSLQAL